jgi:hypothetical protein
MSIVMHGPDRHAPFPHRVVTSSRRIILRNRKHEIISDTISSSEFIICTACGHWVNRVVERCLCVASCHALGEETVTQTLSKISSETAADR